MVRRMASAGPHAGHHRQLRSADGYFRADLQDDPAGALNGRRVDRRRHVNAARARPNVLAAAGPEGKSRHTRVVAAFTGSRAATCSNGVSHKTSASGVPQPLTRRPPSSPFGMGTTAVPSPVDNNMCLCKIGSQQ